MSTRKREALIFTLVLIALVAAHAAVYRASEPFYYNDETRHVMTGVYFRDVFADMPFGNLRAYTVSYYLQYPALGLLVWADKIIFSVLVNPQVGYTQAAQSDDDILATIYKYDPEFIVAEQAQPADALPVENQVRDVLNHRTDRFQVEQVINIESNDPTLGGKQIKVFRNLQRNRDPERRLDVNLLMLQRNVQTVVP